MSGVKYLFGFGLVVFSSQMYHSFRRSKQTQFRQLYEQTADKARLLKSVHQSIAETWDKEMDSFEWSKRIDKYRKVLCSYAEGKVLQIGIGTGLNFQWYKKGVYLTGVDWSPKMLEECRKKGEFNLVQADMRNLPFADGEFDCVVSAFALCSCIQPKEVVRQAMRVLKRGGKFLVLEYGVPSSILMQTHSNLYRYQYIFKYGYDQCCEVKKIMKDLPVTV